MHWEHSTDYREWTYRLRPDVRWHDGRPVTMDDVEFTLRLHSRPDSPYWGPSLVEALTVHDEATFTVRGLGWSDAAVSILPKHLVQSLDYQKFYDWDFWLRPVGNGPYRYVRHEPQTMVELEANPGYYKGKPRIARVVLKFAGPSRLTELLSGNVDAIETNPAQLPSIANDSRFRTFWELNPHGPWTIVWQNEHPLFREREVRRALSLAINRRELLQVLNLPSQCSLVDGLYTKRQFQRGDGTEPRYDPAEARRLLDQAGWRQRNRDEMRERGGHDFHFTALTLAEFPGAETAVYLQDQLRRIGVNMELQHFERGVLLDRLKTGKFESIVGFMIDPESFGEPGGIGYRNAQMTNLVQVARTTADPDALDQAYREMSELLRVDQPVAFLFRRAVPHVVHRRVQGLIDMQRANPLLFAEDLQLEER